MINSVEALPDGVRICRGENTVIIPYALLAAASEIARNYLLKLVPVEVPGTGPADIYGERTPVRSLPLKAENWDDEGPFNHRPGCDSTHCMGC